VISSLAVEAVFPVAVGTVVERVVVAIAAVDTAGFVQGIVIAPSAAAMTVRKVVDQMVIEIAYHSPKLSSK
jgi:hypothetical protein